VKVFVWCNMAWAGFKISRRMQVWQKQRASHS
jgi:hypothetical protein